jgi:DKNYY family
MLKILLITSIIFVISFFLFFPFWHVGGSYYRGLLLIYGIRQKTSSDGFLPPLPFEKEITFVKWADPTSFEYVRGDYAKDRFNVYLDAVQIEGFDPNTFKVIQAPTTGESFYADKTNLRIEGLLALKKIAGEEDSLITENFDIKTFQALGFYIIKDKNGVYIYLHSVTSTDDYNRTELYEKVKDVDSDTFTIEFCDGKYCYANDKINHYKIKVCRRLFCKTEFEVSKAKD